MRTSSSEYTSSDYTNMPSETLQNMLIKQPVEEYEIVGIVEKNALEIKDVSEQMSTYNPLKYWMKLTIPFLKPGGKYVALILSLGVVSIPLMISGNVWVAPILATAASIVAICACWM
ncbi:hypothetical protein [Nostoc sp.]|uniref:hypothetical protein n=1 Tax=Nostoc sp. TaxID=1180 RepID=UPI003593D3EE